MAIARALAISAVPVSAINALFMVFPSGWMMLKLEASRERRSNR
jgi:hypothetical protein